MRINLNAMGLFGSGKVTTPLYADSHIMQFYWKIVPNMGDPYVPTGISECNGHVSQFTPGRSEESSTIVLFLP